MISLESQPSQDALTRLAHFEAQRREALEAGGTMPASVAKGYRHPVVKACIVTETSGKCAYCESKMTHVSWGDVEHLLCKAKYPDRVFEYENLTLACSICNVNKGDYDDPDHALLNPYCDEPERCLVALGQLIWARPGNQRAETTILVLRLNRPDLVERRLRRLKDIALLADKYATSPSGPLKEALGAQLQEEMQPSSEFSFVIRGYLERILDLEAQGAKGSRCKR